MFKNRAAVVPRPAGRRLLVALTCVAAFASVVATAGAVHWPFYGGDAGRSGYQPVEEPTTPLALQYQKGDDAVEINDRNIQNSIVTTTGTPETQRFAYGTEGDNAVAGNAHLQILATGAPVGPENGILVDDGADDADTFRPTGTIASQCTGASANVGTNLTSAGIAFADSSTAGGLGQLYVVHNDDNQDGTNDVALAVIDEATGAKQDFALGTTDGFTVFSSPVLSAAQVDDPATVNIDETGNRVLFFIACRPAVADDPLTVPVETKPFEVRLFRVGITNNAGTVNATIGTPTSVVIPNGNPVASPSLVNLTSGNATTAYVAVSAGGTGPTVQTYRQDTLAPGPTSGDLGDDGQTPSVAVTGTGGPDPSSDEIYVAVGQTPSGGNAASTNTQTRVYRLTYNPAVSPALVIADTSADSPALGGTPAPALAVNEEAGEADGDVVVTTSTNLYVLDAETLDQGDRLYFGDAATSGDGFSRTTAAVSGDLAFVSTDNGRQLVVRLSNAELVTAQEFTQSTQNGAATFSTGQPSISRRFVQYQSDQGAFVYLGTGGQFAINDVEVVEGDTGTRIARFTVTRTGSTADSQTVTVRTSDGPAPAATAGQDYQAVDTTVTFQPGDTTKTVEVTIISDTIEEPDERFTVTLSNATGGATIADDTGIGTILDDDDVAPPVPQPTTFSIGDASVTEGDAGTTEATFTITKSGPGAASVTVDTADGTATAPGDYTARSGVVVAFEAGETTKTFTVEVQGDTSDENDETFTVNLSAPTSGATISDGSGTGLIADDDEPVQPAEPDPTVSVSDNSAAEGDAGTSSLTFTVSLSRPAEKPTTVSYATTPGSAGAPGDFTGTSGTVDFAVGEQSKTITVQVVGDLVDEADETFKITLSSPANAALGDAEGTGTVVDDDRALVSVNDASATEGDISAVPMTFVVYLSTPSASEISVSYVTADINATSGRDYTVASGTVRFAPGETQKSIGVSVLGDRTEEATERFQVTLSRPVNAGLLKANGVGTIADDEAAPRVDPRGLSARTTPKRDRSRPYKFTTTGRVLLPSGLTAEQACNVGRVSVTFKVVRKTVSSRRANLNDDCTFRSAVTLDKRSRLGDGVLRVEVRWLGNGDLRPLGPKRYSVRAG